MCHVTLTWSGNLKLLLCSCFSLQTKDLPWEGEHKSPFEVHRILESNYWTKKPGIHVLPWSSNQQKHLETLDNVSKPLIWRLSTSGFHWVCTDRPSGTGDGHRAAAPCWNLTIEVTLTSDTHELCWQCWTAAHLGGCWDGQTFSQLWGHTGRNSREQGGPSAIHRLLKISVFSFREKEKKPNSNSR